VATHIIHDPIEDVGLQDDCPECVRKTVDPVAYLDGENFRQLWAIMIRCEFGDTTDACPASVAESGSYRTLTERAAAERLYFAARVMERGGIDPRDFAP
jgi:hypothetical protein